MFCGSCPEKAVDLFLKCVFSRSVIGTEVGGVGFQELGANVREAWEVWLGAGSRVEVAKVLTFLAANW